MTPLRFVICILISIPSYTYSSEGSDDHSGVSVEKGKAKSEMCQGCHGPDGNSFSPEWPNLASQNVNYLAKQIHDFQSGARQDATMQSMVTGLGEQDIADITAYFAAQKVAADASSTSVVGEKLFRGGNRYTRLPACAGCHGPNGVGNGPGAIPSLAGQKAGYVAKAMRDFKSGARSNDRNKIMRDVAAKMTEQEIAAVAKFLAGLGAPKATPQ